MATVGLNLRTSDGFNFFPRWEMRIMYSRGPTVFACVLFWVMEGILDFQNMHSGEAFLRP